MLSVSVVRLAPVALAVTLFACKGPPTPKSDTDRAPEDELAGLPPPDVSLGDGYTVGRPVVDGRIALVPVYAEKPPALSFVTLTDGMKAGKVTVQERGGYDAVEIVNHSPDRVFAMSGELIIDGHQDRTIAENAIIAPNETQVVAVRCVEARRSSGPTSVFNALGAIAEPSIRRRLRYKDQSEVWVRINEINLRLGLSPDTQTYRFAALKQTEGAARVRRDKLLETLNKVPDRDRMVGLGLAVDGQMIAIDRFATPALYRTIEPRLVASYLPAESDQPPRVPRELLPGDVRRLAQPSAESRTAAASEYLRPLEEFNSDRD
jgi:hypothetical protein